MLPEIVLRGGEGDLDKRPPLWPFWFADQAHVRFAWEAVAFARVASNARANDVFPCSCASAIARHDVIKIEFTPIENLAAVLAGVFVALKNVVTRKFHFLLWKPIENEQHNHPGNTNLKRNRRDYFVIRSICR